MTSSGVVGYNFYINGVKINPVPIADPGKFTFDGLLSSRQYPIYATAVDRAGNESEPSEVINPSTLTVTQTDLPMLQTDTMVVDSLVANALAKWPEGQTGVTVSITGPKGYYTKSYGTEMTNDGHFRMGSLTKTFTATAVLMAVDDGLISLDDTISQYIPGIPNGGIITIEDMLCMRSGIVDDQSNMSMKIQLLLNPTAPWAISNTVNYIKSSASQFLPGAAFQYVNSNYILLGLMLQVVTGRTIRNIITEDIITPLGLTETSYPTGPTVPAPHGKGFWINPLVSIPIIGWFFSNDITSLAPGFADCAGCMITTIHDATKWVQELRDNTLLSSEMHNLRISKCATLPTQKSSAPKSQWYPDVYGYGYAMVQAGSWFGHDGSWPGWDCGAMYEPSTGATIVVAENCQTISPVILVALSVIWADLANFVAPGSTLLPGFVAGKNAILQGISSEEDFGEPAVTGGVVIPNLIKTTGIHSQEMFGTSLVSEMYIPNTVPGMSIINPPSYLEEGDSIIAAAIGSGGGGGFFSGATNGQGGNSADWEFADLIYGEDLPLDEPIVEFIGSGGSPNSQGHESIIGYGLSNGAPQFAYDAQHYDAVTSGSTVSVTHNAPEGSTVLVFVMLKKTLGTLTVHTYGEEHLYVASQNAYQEGENLVGLMTLYLENAPGGDKTVVFKLTGGTFTYWEMVIVSVLNSSSLNIQGSSGLGNPGQIVPLIPNLQMVVSCLVSDTVSGSALSSPSGGTPAYTGPKMAVRYSTLDNYFSAENSGEISACTSVILNPILDEQLLISDGGWGGASGSWSASANNPNTGQNGIAAGTAIHDDFEYVGGAQVAANIPGNSPGGGGGGATTYTIPGTFGGDGMAAITFKKTMHIQLLSIDGAEGFGNLEVEAP